ncbi:glycosyltransferase [Acidomonas methanolica]|uniref:Glycosyl transferase n=1 Tax=Acidomonas methanolica NBRC 104435 TaxID=1231351 RepID=A0A023D6I2_ACIMT|nr:glycosyltransferase [Acidomonas methanolica]MBU2655446.1 glycosyltransferase [Acidomonas methanolica]TCS23329.1 UDP:flavonoid glycosyltransferase YjiC (YdhE family) [Acidomonas methanolica]GAJ29684.1 glycosyl transferase [Acidomonas methanolica NBRC 104435]GBQ52674.1 glucosyltransferase [Acidomonas methanolica]GEL00272.1 glycosyl hydrolase [Acidomonas methanolica NBRC 104435]
MTVVIFTVGTEGDIRPHLALGRGLRAEGHAVRLVTDPGFAASVARAGLDFAPLNADFGAMMRRNPQALDGRSGLAAARVVIAETRRAAQDWPAQGLAAMAECRLVIGSGNATLLAATLAEKAGVPFVQTQLQPLDASRALPPVWFRPRPLPGAANYALHGAMRRAAWWSTRAIANDMRRTLEAAPYPWRGPWESPHATGGYRLYGFSRHVVPRQPEWPETIAMPGYFILPPDEDYVPPGPLAAFLGEGSGEDGMPVYIGFGSMVSAHAERLAAVVREAAALTGMRIVVGSGWSGMGRFLADLPNIMSVSDVPHEWLFRRVRAAVHHCGAGTAAAAVRAGIPTVPVPFVGDQHFWGWQLGRIGVATVSQNMRHLTGAALARALEAAVSPAMRARARALGETVAAEDGVGNAIAQLRRWALL